MIVQISLILQMHLRSNVQHGPTITIYIQVVQLLLQWREQDHSHLCIVWGTKVQKNDNNTTTTTKKKKKMQQTWLIHQFV